MMTCTYCGGEVVWNADNIRHEHATSGERIPTIEITSGDYVSAAHNRAGTRVGAYDIEESA